MMLKPLFTAKIILISLLLNCPSFAAAITDKTEKTPIVITSQSLTADNKNSTATFEGAVVANTEYVTIHADKMTVFYDNSANKVKKIHASGNVKVLKDDRALFSNEATYIEEKEIITFSGNPKAVEGENVISGTQIIFHLKEDRAVVEGSKVFLQNRQDLN